MGFEEEISGFLQKHIGRRDIKLEVPKNPGHGDYAFPCFILSKEMKRSPAEIAGELAGKLKPSGSIAKIEAAGPYLNFFVDKSREISESIMAAIKTGDKYGSSGAGKGKNALVEHTSVNPNASPHLGRARNAMIGDSIVRILRFHGYKTEAHYFVNDVGKQIAMLAIGCRGKKKVTFQDLLQIYMDVSKKAEDNPEFENEIFALLKKLEDGDAKTKKEFEDVVGICINGQKAILQEFGIEYDSFDHESKYLWSKRTKEILEKLQESGKLFTDEENRQVLDLKGFNISMENPVQVLTRADGTSLYPLRDIAYHIEKLEKAKENIVVLGEDHKLYFQQLTASLKLLGFDAPRVVHYSFVLLNEGKMSTRKGNVVLLEDFMNEAREKAEHEIRKRHGEIANVTETAKIIGYGAVKYAILKVSSEKNVIFDWDAALSFEGDAGPYVQYSHARIASIIGKFSEKYSGKMPRTAKLELLKADHERILAGKIAEFPAVAEKALQDLKPHIIANYATELAQRFNEFYHNCPVLQEDEHLMHARLLLCSAAKQALKNALFLLGIEAPERM